jgi:protein-tyrosine phosphatase
VLASSSPSINELKELFREGFRTMISLLDESERRPDYCAAEAQAMGFNWFSVPVKDFHAPRFEDFQRFLDIIHKIQDAGPVRGRSKVLVHCWGGLGRTGTMGAAYWIDKGLSADEAIRQIRTYAMRAAAQLGPGRRAIEIPEQEQSLHGLEARLKGSRDQEAC